MNDSIEYEILINAVIQVQNIVGFTCEIGVREGVVPKLF